MNYYWYILINWSPYFIQISLVFTYCPIYLVPGSNLGGHITFSYHVSLGSSWLQQFLRYSLFLMTLTVLRSVGQMFCRLSLSGFCLTFFSWWDWVMGSGEKDHRGKLPVSSHPIKSTYYQPDLSLLTLTLVTWLRQYRWDFSTPKLLFSPFRLSSLEGGHPE